MNWPTPTLADVFKARRAIAPYLQRTPVLEPAGLAAALGCRAVLKCENLNPTGAFKVRGGVNLVASLEPQVRARGVVAASTGNHGQSVAYAARLFATQAMIFMPEAANPLKVAATLALGAEVIQTGHDFDAARLAAEEYAARQDVRYIHSSNEPMLVAGVATAALELLEAVPELERQLSQRGFERPGPRADGIRVVVHAYGGHVPQNRGCVALFVSTTALEAPLAAPVFVLARSRTFQVRHAHCVLDPHPPVTPLCAAVPTKRTIP